jgi:hypothetical protein
MGNVNICKQDLNIYISEKDFNVWYSHSYERLHGKVEKIAGYQYTHPSKGWIR